MTKNITMKRFTDADIDKHYTKGALIRNATHRHVTVAQYRAWLKGEG